MNRIIEEPGRMTGEVQKWISRDFRFNGSGRPKKTNNKTPGALDVSDEFLNLINNSNL